MNTKSEDLTAAEQQYLERAKTAEGEGMSLAQYYRANGLSVYSLYNVRRRLVKKGVVARGRAAWSTARAKADSFVAVRVVKPTEAGSSSVCRLRHPSGWVIECVNWPEPSWMAALTGERR
jgi:hypothetical protein